MSTTGSVWLCAPRRPTASAPGPAAPPPASAAMCEAAASPKSRHQQHYARPPLAPRPLHGMGHADAGIHAAIDPQCGKHLWVRRHAGPQHGGRKAVKRKRRVAAEVAVEPPRYPPQARAQQAARTEKRQPRRSNNVGELVAQLPGVESSPLRLAPPCLRACGSGPARALPEDSESAAALTDDRPKSHHEYCRKW
jgi:hypothetical protein